MFLRQYNIDGINLFQTVVKTQSYVAFMRMLSLTAAMLFGTSKPSSLGHHQVILSVQHSTALLLLYPVQDASFDLTMLTCHEALFRPFSKGFVAWLIFETWISLKTCREFLQQGQCVQQDELFSSRFQDNMKRFTANFLSSGFGYFLTELKPVFILQSNTQ